MFNTLSGFGIRYDASQKCLVDAGLKPSQQIKTIKTNFLLSNVFCIGSI